MKKRTIIIIALAAVLLILTVVVFAFVDKGFGISSGSCIAADNGRYLIVMGNSPIAMSAEDKNIFVGLQTGDRILVVHDGINETYPGQTGVKFLMKIGSGDKISEEIMNNLRDLGWLTDSPGEDAFHYPLRVEPAN